MMLGRSEASDSLWTRTTRTMRKSWRKATKAVMRSYHFRIPKYDMPIRLRPWFLAFTALIMVTLAFLGLTNFSHSLPLNDKMLHFICLMLATGVFYFIFDVEEDARRIWFWHHSPLIFTGAMCFFFGGIVSEFVQSMLPHKEFQIGDVFANLLGSSVGLYAAYYLERYYRHRREISRLYRPLNAEEDDMSEDEDLEAGTQLLPTHAETSTAPRDASKGPAKAARFGDVWDEGEELFDIGEESDEEGEPSHARALPPTHLPAPSK